MYTHLNLKSLRALEKYIGFGEYNSKYSCNSDFYRDLNLAKKVKKKEIKNRKICGKNVAVLRHFT